MTTALRPMTTGELLDRTFNLYRNNFVLFAGIAALAALTLVAASVALLALGFAVPKPGAEVDPRQVFQVFAVYFIVLAIFYLVGASLATGATIYAVSKVHLEQPVTIGESYKRVVPRLGRIINIIISIVLRMIGVFLLMYLAAVAVGVLLTFGLAGGGGNRSLPILSIIAIFAIVLVGYGFVLRVYLKYSLAVQACLLENTRAGDSLKRSAFLTKHSLWRIFLVYLLMAVIGLALSFVLQLPAGLIAQRAPMAAVVWQMLATFLAYTLSFPISTIAISLVYYDQRIRKEAFDLQLLMDALGEPTTGQAATAAPIG